MEWKPNIKAWISEGWWVELVMEYCGLTSNRSDRNLSAHTKAMVWAATLNLAFWMQVSYDIVRGQNWWKRIDSLWIWIFIKAFLPFFFSRWSKRIDLCSHPRPSVQKRRAEMWSLRFLAVTSSSDSGYGPLLCKRNRSCVTCAAYSKIWSPHQNRVYLLWNWSSVWSLYYLCFRISHACA